MCSPGSEIAEGRRKEEFEKATPNHESITPSSFACLQATRGNFKQLDTLELDPAADILTVILDTITDKRNIHLVKAVAASDAEKSAFQKVHTPGLASRYACTAIHRSR
jgi:hypothetical protein